MSAHTFKSAVYLEDDTEIDVSISYDAFYQKAKLSGPPEDCYEADGELTINSIIPVQEVSADDLKLAIKNGMDRLENEAWEHFLSYREEN